MRGPLTRALSLYSIYECHLGRLDAMPRLFNRYDDKVVDVLVAGVEVVEGEVVAARDDLELVRLPVVVAHHQAVSVAQA